jgi:membrane protein required for colicin V production
LTVLDLFVVVVVLISAVLAMVRGFVREVLSIASWIAAAAAAYFLYKPVVPLVAPYIESHTIQTIVAAAAIFFIALIVASYVTMKISDFVIDSRVGAFDRALGFLFGAARGILLVVIALLFFNWLVQPSPPWVANARSKGMLEDLGQSLIAALPQDIETSIVQRLRGVQSDEVTGSGEAAPATDAVGGNAGDPDSPTYQNSVRQGLDTLIENKNDNAPAGN